MFTDVIPYVATSFVRSELRVSKSHIMQVNIVVVSEIKACENRMYINIVLALFSTQIAMKMQGFLATNGR